jgi:hypothetical protein
MVYYHKKSVRADEDLDDAIQGTLVSDLRTPRIALSLHRFNTFNVNGQPYFYGQKTRMLPSVGFALVGLFLIIGALVPAIKFEFNGLLGLALEVFGEDIRAYSVVSMGLGMLYPSTTPANVAGILFVQTLFLFIVLIAPLLLVVSFLVLWLAPLTLKEQLLIYFVCEILFAWESSILVLAWFIGTALSVNDYISFVIGKATKGACDAIQEGLYGVDYVDRENQNCVDIIVSLQATFFIFVFGAIGFLVLSIVQFRLARAAIEDRELAMRRKPVVIPGDLWGLEGKLVRLTLTSGDGMKTEFLKTPKVVKKVRQSPCLCVLNNKLVLYEQFQV